MINIASSPGIRLEKTKGLWEWNNSNLLYIQYLRKQLFPYFWTVSKVCREGMKLMFGVKCVKVPLKANANFKIFLWINHSLSRVGTCTFNKKKGNSKSPWKPIEFLTLEHICISPITINVVQMYLHESIIIKFLKTENVFKHCIVDIIHTKLR